MIDLPASLSLPSTIQSPVLSGAIRQRLQAMQPTDLKQLSSVALLNRTDTKYLLTERQMAQILEIARDEYFVLEVAGVRASRYSTQYFDTPDLRMYLDHHNGMRDRYKVRLRSYVDSGMRFLEVKLKTNLERTIKQRLSLAATSSYFTEQEMDFLRAHTPYDPTRLEPTATNDFLRVTLVSTHPARMERLTVDFSLTVQCGERARALPGIVIAEIKQPKFSTQSTFVQLARALGVEQNSFSKYAMGIALLHPHVKRNLFKERIRIIEQLLDQERQ